MRETIFNYNKPNTTFNFNEECRQTLSQQEMHFALRLQHSFQSPPNRPPHQLHLPRYCGLHVINYTDSLLFQRTLHGVYSSGPAGALGTRDVLATSTLATLATQWSPVIGFHVCVLEMSVSSLSSHTSLQDVHDFSQVLQAAVGGITSKQSIDDHLSLYRF
jgi:hypothetical protein